MVNNILRKSTFVEFHFTRQSTVPEVSGAGEEPSSRRDVERHQPATDSGAQDRSQEVAQNHPRSTTSPQASQSGLHGPSTQQGAIGEGVGACDRPSDLYVPSKNCNNETHRKTALVVPVSEWGKYDIANSLFIDDLLATEGPALRGNSLTYHQIRWYVPSNSMVQKRITYWWYGIAK